MNAQELLGIVVSLARKRLTQKQKLILERVASLDREITMSSLTAQLAKELQIGKSTVRVVLQALRDTGLITCGDSVNKGVSIGLTPVGWRVTLALKVGNGTKSSNGNGNLVNLRERIDIIDERILKLIAERVKVAKSIGKVKKENQIDIVSREREIEVLRKWIKNSREVGVNGTAVGKVAKELIELCRSAQ